jgi:hypothetical protein
VGAHDAEYLISIIPEFIYKARGKSPLAIVSMYHELCDPANGLAVILPTVRKRLPCQLAIDNDACVGASLVG